MSTKLALSVVSCFSFSLRSLSDLCAYAVNITLITLTAETQRTQRRRREFRQLAFVLGVIAAICGLISTVSAQKLDVTIRLLPDSNRVAIEATCEPTFIWWFSDSYAGIVGLGNRIERFIAYDEKGKEVSVRKSAPGHFESSVLKPATRFQYEVNLSPPERAADCPLVSWLTRERGLLIASDLLPGLSFPRDAPKANARLRFQLPNLWAVYSTEAQFAQNEFEISDRSEAVFAVGAQLRASQTRESVGEPWRRHPQRPQRSFCFLFRSPSARRNGALKPEDARLPS